MKCLCYTIHATTILTEEQLAACLGMFYYSGGFKGIIIKIVSITRFSFYYEILTSTNKIESRATDRFLLEIREL